MLMVLKNLDHQHPNSTPENCNLLIFIASTSHRASARRKNVVGGIWAYLPECWKKSELRAFTVISSVITASITHFPCALNTQDKGMECVIIP